MISSHAQTSGEKKPTYFEQISIDPEGHVCYLERIGKSDLNRIEYRADGKSELEIFFESDTARSNVRLTDFDNDGKVDLIYVMRESLKGAKTPIRKVDYYRGPQYLEHLKRHFKHALVTASHPLIKNRPDEQERAKQIEKDIARLNSLKISEQEIGTYSQEDSFTESPSAAIQEVFAASDTLNSAVRTVLSGDFRVLSKTPEITSRYNVEINTLVSIDPPLRGSLGKK